MCTYKSIDSYKKLIGKVDWRILVKNKRIKKDILTFVGSY